MESHVQRNRRSRSSRRCVCWATGSIAIMVFDAPPGAPAVPQQREDAERQLETVVNDETFEAADITRGSAGPPTTWPRNARRMPVGVVILTDDQTERDRNDAGVLTPLHARTPCLSALIAPDALHGD